jgi:phosphate transport system substrate-binding protein
MLSLSEMYKQINMEDITMNHKFTIVLSIVLLASIALSACAPVAAAPVEVIKTVQVEVTKMVQGTPQVEVQVVTATPDMKSTELPAGSVTINGAGATFPLPVYTEWNYAFQYVDPAVVLNYQGIGSGGGKKGIIDRTIDYAGSDSLLKYEEYQKGGDLQMFPVLAGAVVPIYNIEGVTKTLTLDGNALAGIYGGTITKWNDDAIQALNPDLAAQLPDKPITAVHRSDGSGTTEIFTKFLAAANEAWKSAPGAGSAIEWPVDKAGNGIGGKGNQGVAVNVLNTKNSIGYVELSYAIANKIAYARMVNAAGKTVTADEKSLASAITDYANAFSDKLTTDLVNGAGAGTWPIAGYTYIILHMTSMDDCVKAQKLVEYLSWALTDPAAASRAADLGYTVLPEAVRGKVLAKMAEITCNGQPVSTK